MLTPPSQNNPPIPNIHKDPTILPIEPAVDNPYPIIADTGKQSNDIQIIVNKIHQEQEKVH